jgi:hypothetical protein
MARCSSNEALQVFLACEVSGGTNFVAGNLVSLPVSILLLGSLSEA